MPHSTIADRGRGEVICGCTSRRRAYSPARGRRRAAVMELEHFGHCSRWQERRSRWNATGWTRHSRERIRCCRRMVAQFGEASERSGDRRVCGERGDHFLVARASGRVFLNDSNKNTRARRRALNARVRRLATECTGDACATAMYTESRDARARRSGEQGVACKRPARVRRVVACSLRSSATRE